MTGSCQIGVVGLGTMGKNLALNMTDHDIRVAGYVRDVNQVPAIDAESGGRIAVTANMADFVASLKSPRAILMLVPAGDAVDQVVATLRPYLSAGDILIDGGNSFFRDTDRRHVDLAASGIEFIGIGVSGGEEGARRGPSMMAGGTESAYARVAPILEVIGAKAADGASCVGRMGNGAAGHYVKMVHNGIEYGLMQLIAETYDFLRRAGDASNDEAAEAFGTWARSEFGGYLLEITESVLRHRDPESGESTVDFIVDGAKQKGTGKWTSQNAFDLHVPVPTIDAAVSARDLSGFLTERKQAAKTLGKLPISIEPDLDRIGDALHAASLVTFAQGFSLLRAASVEYAFDLDFVRVAQVWRAGCIIRSALLPAMVTAFQAKADLENLLLDRAIADRIVHLEGSLRWMVSEAARSRIPAPAYSASLAYLDGYTSGRLPANLIQGLRDCFGAHGFSRTDREGTFHADWQGADGER